MKVFFYTYLDRTLKALITIFLADLLQRSFLATREYFLFPIYYEHNKRLKNILKYAFTYTIATTTVLVCTAFIAIWHCSTNDFFWVELFPWLLHIPIYWLLTFVNFNHSTLNYSHWIREQHGLDYATGMASSYFHGYLKLTMPSNDHPGIRQRIELYEAKNRVKFAVNRLIILIPNTMFVDSKIEGKYLEKAGPLEAVIKQRAGVARYYKNDVYKITEPINGDFYYIALEGATPMLTFFESMHFKLSSTWQMEAMQREILIKFFKHLKKLLNEWPETQQECELLLYNSHTDDGRKQDVSEVIKAHISYLWNEGRA